MWAVLLFWCGVCGLAAGQPPPTAYDCATLDSITNCATIATPTCNQLTKTCFVHPNVCGGFRRFITAGYLGNGWTIVFSTTTFQCTSSNLAACVDYQTIASSPQLASTETALVRSCIPPGLTVYLNNLNFVTTGDSTGPTPSVYVSQPSPSVQSCSILRFTGANVSIAGINFDGTNCLSTGIPTTGIIAANSRFSLVNSVITGVTVPVSYTGASCELNWLFDVTTGSAPNLPFLSNPVLLVAAPCETKSANAWNVTLIGYSGPPPAYTVILANSQITFLEAPSTFIVVDTNSLFNNFSYMPTYCAPVTPPPPPSTSCISPITTVTVTEAPSNLMIYIIIPIALFVAFVAIYLCAHAAKRTKARMAANKAMTAL